MSRVAERFPPEAPYTLSIQPSALTHEADRGGFSLSQGLLASRRGGWLRGARLSATPTAEESLMRMMTHAYRAAIVDVGTAAR